MLIISNELLIRLTSSHDYLAYFILSVRSLDWSTAGLTFLEQECNDDPE